ncbi:methyltransferase type 12 [Serinicoccus hydrothermalis]|uniref:Methyltransferase type 12 n=1 Tax=Serinicoccus hydrothermalis TaxID=1758689 RepID=A0A1B1NE18_9MICO|nr:class I SAM-dependent methyltransferase [Serinicoccus hydrothermalis]ANS79666.1 methyltransferase type 12 [Serinicoccus hydrothermalis]
MALSARLAAVVDALPLRPGMRVLEVGGAPGAAAREIVRRIGDGHVHVVDRSERGVRLVERACAPEIAAGRLSVRCVDVEDFELDGQEPFDLALACRVGVFDGRHPGAVARRRVAAALAPGGRFFVDGGNPLREVDLRGCV